MEDTVAAKKQKTEGGRIKRVWCVRHGQAEHNVEIHAEVAKFKAEGREWSLANSKALTIRDPGLTAFGKEQARIASTDPLIADSALSPTGSDECAQLVVVSPLRRTLQTALGLCSGRAFPILATIAHPDLQECMPVPCDTGRPLPALKEEFGGSVDFSLLESQPETWFNKPAPVTQEDKPDPEGQAALRACCERFTEWLASRPEERIIVVAHHTLFCHLLKMDFLNCEIMQMALRVDSQGRGSWSVIEATGEVVPLYLADGREVTFCGSPPVSGTLAACLTKHGREAAQLTAQRAGLPDPVSNPPRAPAAPPTT